MIKIKKISILALALLIAVISVVLYEFTRSKKTTAIEPKDLEIDVSKLTVYETLPDYDYSGPTLQLIFVDAEKKPIRNFKGHLTLDGGPGSSPGSFSNYDFDSCKFALVESQPNNRAILAGGRYSFIVMVNGKSHILPDKIEMPRITQGIKEYKKIINIADLLGRQVERDSYSGITITGDVTSLGDIDSESYIAFDCDPVYSIVKIKADKSFEIRAPRLAGNICVFDPRGRQLLAFRNNIDRLEIREFEIIKNKASLIIKIEDNFAPDFGSVSISLRQKNAKYAWITFPAGEPDTQGDLHVPYGDYILTASGSRKGGSIDMPTSIAPGKKVAGEIFGRKFSIEEKQ